MKQETIITKKNQESILYKNAIEIINYSINKVLPNIAVKNALKNFKKPLGKTIMIAIGKAAYTMAKETINHINIDEGLVITKYNHSKAPLKNTKIIEAGHPLLDNNSLLAGDAAIKMCQNLTKDDVVIFLVSGGGSSLFESPLISLEELIDINNQLLKCGANIREINTIRKRFSKVKGGKFANLCFPAKVFNIILSDIINDPLDMIASGPTYIDNSTCQNALEIVNKYELSLSSKAMELLNKETIKKLDNIETYITGNNEELKQAANKKAKELGYKVYYLDKPFICDVKDASIQLINEIEKHKDEHNIAIIAGGEIVVKIKGNGLGGRNQELALRCAQYLKDKDACVFCIGSDGTDGPTDAAGGYVDNQTYKNDLDDYLINNDSYHYLLNNGGLIITGPTGTNVCDLYCILKK